ncbi:glycosyltransferase [Salinimonas iocasae]|uniref:Glycosyltransferase n=1 Tax=Salinimonas iocasae TaxID=2572577 RepID=A0A5B7YFQ4_9ALTE|nr:glycosyltransferase [Salinimonas iocasae]QCZ94451.1 glycosyltransferase [Salinimonas iocasae]
MNRHNSIAFIINSLEGGGAERVMCKLLSIMEPYFTQHQIHVHLVLLDALAEAHECPDYVNKITLNTEGSLVQGYRQLKPLLKQLSPSLCLSFLTRSNMLNVVLSHQLGYQAVISERVNTSSHFPGGLKDTISKVMVKATYPRAHRVMAVSEGVKADLVEHFNVKEDRVQTVYNPYDIDAIHELADKPVDDLPQNAYIIGTGRLVKNKNFRLLIDAYAKSDVPEDLVILGQGDQEAALKEQVSRLGLSERVHFPGFKSNPYPYIKQARYFVSTSNAEGFPNAIVEAMCLGKAVVATNCESGPAEILSGEYPLHIEQFTPSQYGCLCPVNDAKAVADAMDFLNAPTELARYSAKSTERAQAFSNEIFRQKMMTCLDLTPGAEDTVYVPAG